MSRIEFIPASISQGRNLSRITVSFTKPLRGKLIRLGCYSVRKVS